MTILRKKHTDGIWYDQVFVTRGAIDKEQLMLIIRTQVYMSLLYGIVDLNCRVIGPSGTEVCPFEESKFQGEEIERILPGHKAEFKPKQD
jgi:hypothetical protein